MVRQARALLQALLLKYSHDRITQKAAALAFFTALSLAPLLLIATSIAGFIFGEATARDELIAQAQTAIGDAGAEVIGTILANAAEPSGNLLALAVGLGGMLLGASNIFVQLRQTLDAIWGVGSDPNSGVQALLATRVVALLGVLGAGVVLVAVLLMTLALSALQALLPAALVLQVLELLGSLLMYGLLFALVFKFLPRVQVPWRDAWLGAAVTAVLFQLGTQLMRRYLSQGAIASVYGAAGSLLALLVWLFYSAQILLIGAQLTQLSSRLRGLEVQPKAGAVVLERARQAAEQALALRVQQAQEGL